MKVIGTGADSVLSASCLDAPAASPVPCAGIRIRASASPVLRAESNPTMKTPVHSFAAALRVAQTRQHLTQRALAEKLHMSVRSIIEIELRRSNPRFETAALLTEELNISLDAIVFPNTATAARSKIVQISLPERVKRKYRSTFLSAYRQMHLRLTSKRQLFGISGSRLLLA